MRALAFTVILAAATPSYSLAQDDIVRVPLHIPPSFDLGYDIFAADIAGLKLGQSVDDATAALEARGCDTVERDVAVLKSYGSEDNVLIEYVGDNSYVQVLGCEFAKDGVQERYEVIFTSHFTGNVAMNVRREVRYGPETEPITPESFAQAVSKKYGKPKGDGQRNFIWIDEKPGGEPERLTASVNITRDVVTEASFTLQSNRLSRRNMSDMSDIEKNARVKAKEFALERGKQLSGKGKAPEL